MKRTKAISLLVLMMGITAWAGTSLTLPGDPNCDGLLNVFDIDAFEADWGTPGDPPPCNSDFDGNGIVNGGDLVTFMNALALP